MFKNFNSFKKRHKILFAIIIGFSVVLFWRGAWGVLDVLLFPDDYLLSSVSSLILGLVLLLLTDYVIEELI